MTACRVDTIEDVQDTLCQRLDYHFRDERLYYFGDIIAD